MIGAMRVIRIRAHFVIIVDCCCCCRCCCHRCCCCSFVSCVLDHRCDWVRAIDLCRGKPVLSGASDRPRRCCVEMSRCSVAMSRCCVACRALDHICGYVRAGVLVCRQFSEFWQENVVAALHTLNSTIAQTEYAEWARGRGNWNVFNDTNLAKLSIDRH